ncbi:MAG: hypothetical protein VB092_01495, partial [Oscillospiraceae bacterium]|nr:hypothetical protein [Oscillospiraceae bacterium]
AKKLREAAQAGRPLPWTVVLTVGGDTPAEKLVRLLSDCRETGIYLFFLTIKTRDTDAVRALCAQFPDCAFILFAECCADAPALTGVNALTVPPLDDPRFPQTKDALRASGALYGAFVRAGAAPLALPEIVQRAGALDAPILFMSEPMTADTQRALEAFRAAPSAAVFPVALPHDLLQVSRRISERAMYFEVEEDGAAALRTDAGSSPLPNVFDTPFGLVLRKIR